MGPTSGTAHKAIPDLGHITSLQFDEIQSKVKEHELRQSLRYISFFDSKY